MEVKREQPNESDIVTNGRNPKESQSKSKSNQKFEETYTTLTQKKIGVNVTKRWAKTKLSKLGPNEDY